MTKGIIFYTDNRIKEPIKSAVRKALLQSDLPIVSVSLEPIDFGKNIVIKGERSYPTMIRQILTALEESETDNVFFCEHDVLYHKSHFDFTPQYNSIFYYNSNVWRWWYGSDKVIKHHRMLPLSCLCVNRDFALRHYKFRQQKIEEFGLDEFRSREPRKGRIWGYEPGTKKIKRGGLTDDDFDTWESDIATIDIRHPNTFSAPKIQLSDFKHQPTGWKEIPIEQIPGWDLKTLFNL